MIDKGQVGLSIVSPSRLPNIWNRYMAEKIDENIFEGVIGTGRGGMGVGFVMQFTYALI